MATLLEGKAEISDYRPGNVHNKHEDGHAIEPSRQNKGKAWQSTSALGIKIHIQCFQNILKDLHRRAAQVTKVLSEMLWTQNLNVTCCVQGTAGNTVQILIQFQFLGRAALASGTLTPVTLPAPW